MGTGGRRALINRISCCVSEASVFTVSCAACLKFELSLVFLLASGFEQRATEKPLQISCCYSGCLWIKENAGFTSVRQIKLSLYIYLSLDSYQWATYPFITFLLMNSFSLSLSLSYTVRITLPKSLQFDGPHALLCSVYFKPDHGRFIYVTVYLCLCREDLIRQCIPLFMQRGFHLISYTLNTLNKGEQHIRA